jgi:hypothetical protein
MTYKTYNEALEAERSRPRPSPHLCAECVLDLVQERSPIYDTDEDRVADVAAHLADVTGGRVSARVVVNGQMIDLRAVTMIKGTLVCGKTLHINYARGKAMRDN